MAHLISTTEYHGMTEDTSRKLVCLSDGTLYAIYHKQLAGKYQIYVKKSTNKGVTWTDETRISTYSGMDIQDQYFPSIAVDSSDYLHVVWHGKATGYPTKRQIWYNKYTDSWAGPVRISTYSGMGNYNQYYASIAVDSSDYPHVVWYGTATGYPTKEQIWYAKYTTSWATPVRISTYSGMGTRYQRYPSIAVDSLNNLHVAWRGLATGYTTYYQIWYAKYTTSWATPVRLSTYSGMNGTNQFVRSIAVDSNNFVHVVWHGRATGYTHSQIWYNKYTDSWAGPVRISTYSDMDVNSQVWSSIAVDSNDYLHVVWQGKGTGDTVSKIWYAKYTTSWATPERLQATGTNKQPFARWSRYPSINIPYDGVDYVFIEGTSSPYNLYWDKKDNPLPPILTVTTDAATDLATISAMLNGTLNDDGGEDCECGFEWGPDTGYGVTTPTESKTTGQAFSQVIGGLFPDTTYHFRAFATNSAGTSYGADRTFTTKPVISRAYALARRQL